MAAALSGEQARGRWGAGSILDREAGLLVSSGGL